MNNSFHVNPSAFNPNLFKDASLPIYNASSLNGEIINISNLVSNEILVYNGIEWLNEPYIKDPI